MPYQYDAIVRLDVSDNGFIPVGIKREDRIEDSYTWNYIDTTGKEVISLPEEIVEAERFKKVE